MTGLDSLQVYCTCSVKVRACPESQPEQQPDARYCSTATPAARARGASAEVGGVKPIGVGPDVRLLLQNFGSQGEQDRGQRIALA